MSKERDISAAYIQLLRASFNEKIKLELQRTYEAQLKFVSANITALMWGA